MSIALKQLRRRQQERVNRIKTILDKADESNDFSAIAEANTLKKEAAEDLEKIKELESLHGFVVSEEADLNASAGRISTLSGGGKGRGRSPDGEIRLYGGKSRRMKRCRFRIKSGTETHFRCEKPYRQAFAAYLGGSGPSATLQTDVQTSGGYLAPEQFNAELIKELDDDFWIRKLARTILTDSPTLGTPYRSARVQSGTWGPELTTSGADTAYKIGMRRLEPHYYTNAVNLSRDLLRSAVMDVEGIVRDEIGYRSRQDEEIAFLTGDGVGKPLGLFTASANGISTSRDIAGQSQTAITADDLFDMVTNIKQQYLSSASVCWIFHRLAMRQIRKLKDGNSNYLLERSLTAGAPMMLLGFPVYISENAPSTFTAGSYVGLLGDMSYYWIADALGMSIQRLIEVMAQYNQDQFLFRRKLDGQPVLEEAFTRLKLAA